MRTHRRLWIVLLALGAGCATGPQPPVKDPSKAEYYSADELMRLDGPERDRYCAYMENSLQTLKRERDVYTRAVDSLNVGAEEMRSKSIELSAQIVKLQQEVRELRLKEKALQSYVVKPGDTLKGIARSALGDEARWREILDSNRTTLTDEKAELRPGMRLNLPKSTKTGG